MDITFKDVSYTYQPGTPFQGIGLKHINLTIESGSYTALIGHTGSGKSTLLQHLNALLKPTEGVVQIGDRQITPETNNKNLKVIRQKVGMVFQFPESQLFEATVQKDIAFGPQNFGVPEAEALERAKAMVELVGLPAAVLDQSPFDLSGGQMRRVAIAGVLAMQPEVLILDEPTAGLDPVGRREMMGLFEKLHREQGMTIVMVTHQMDDVANYADHVVVLENGGIAKSGTPREIFADPEWLTSKQLGLPTTTQFAQALIKKGFVFPQVPLTEHELAAMLRDQLPQEAGGANE
ncbi:energy-coupling factor transporter ATP-binding protein EcfA2 [Latilactobacillus sakei]|uniref:energy-coupling factor ABC transporter ATP-binding protein n=1 Tax=Latilactobacillus sakei TaxID=1599 RepID=UPI0004691FF7|nr:energy-coupling factor ABC transporter ATP-binding protein [Latilactobacillus sakei]ARJ71906.1 energy-coupling factor transporter ATPase [Latilactobacillus sakei]AST84271.1 energy-coupling factor transporter ATPase [Latilactobacillus sakei]AWZ42219.1 energy-coupling factor transporter ATPase [Latilactobacillus sakei]AWZ46611.1 energy-coupling factor transporter ATPase [Latilactobacillus sakei]KGB14133.1 cobalt ABC transporter [Latilactobacillus sakei]